MHNFGKINNGFSEVLVESFIKKDLGKKNIFKEYLKTLKESEILKTQYFVYKNITNKCELNEVKVSEFIKETISLMDRFKPSEIKKENKKLIKLIGENVNLLDLDYKCNELHNNINNLILTKKTSKSINSLVESFNYIVEYIKNNKIEIRNDKPTFETGVIGQLAVDKFNKKYSNLNEDLYNVLKTVINYNNADKEVILSNTIIECGKLIDSKLIELNENDTTTKDKLIKVKDKLTNMVYNEETFVNDITKIIELKKDLV